jgi:hypothetical protein
LVLAVDRPDDRFLERRLRDQPQCLHDACHRMSRHVDPVARAGLLPAMLLSLVNGRIFHVDFVMGAPGQVTA